MVYKAIDMAGETRKFNGRDRSAIGRIVEFDRSIFGDNNVVVEPDGRNDIQTEQPEVTSSQDA